MSPRLPISRGVLSLLAAALLAGCGDGPTEGGERGGGGARVTGITPATLTPGATAVITGAGFSTAAAGNTVTVGGVTAEVTGWTATRLQITVPCAPSGSVAVRVTADGVPGAAVDHPLQVPTRTLAVGQSVIVTSAEQAGCNEIAAANGPARYVVAVYNANPSPAASAAFQLAGDGVASPGGALPQPRATRVTGGGAPQLSAIVEEAMRERADLGHLELLEKNRVAHDRLLARFGNRPATVRARASRAPVPPPLTRSFRVSDINSGSICSSFLPVSATRVFYDGRVAIYQDDANPITTAHLSLGATMQDYYDRIGTQFNADMEPIIRGSFGDVLRRDSLTDNNGVVVALFTQTINTSFPSVAGFVVSCDQFPNDEGAGNTNTASNFGEYFYAYVPTAAASGYNSGLTPDSWYRTIRSTFIHETKHVASHAARVANGTTLEQSWLEEGTARHSEELWARSAVYNVGWKGNTGYGGAADLGSIYCDARPTVAGCQATSSARPSLNMQRHFAAGGLYEFMGNPSARSPFGRSHEDGGSSFYATAWSLARYALDRYGESDAAFLSGLNQSSATGTANLAAAAGVTLERLLGGWALAMYADDYPGLSGASADMRFPTWNLTDIYAGLRADYPEVYSRPWRIAAESIPFGTFAPLTAASVVGGGVRYYEVSGTQGSAQLIRLQGVGGGAAPSTLRVAIARLQ
jgi:hypothetical protein